MALAAPLTSSLLSPMPTVSSICDHSLKGKGRGGSTSVGAGTQQVHEELYAGTQQVYEELYAGTQEGNEEFLIFWHFSTPAQ